jgi:hypothetical protein
VHTHKTPTTATTTTTPKQQLTTIQNDNTNSYNSGGGVAYMPSFQARFFPEVATTGHGGVPYAAVTVACSGAFIHRLSLLVSSKYLCAAAAALPAAWLLRRRGRRVGLWVS